MCTICLTCAVMCVCVCVGVFITMDKSLFPSYVIALNAAVANAIAVLVASSSLLLRSLFLCYLLLAACRLYYSVHNPYRFHFDLAVFPSYFALQSEMRIVKLDVPVLSLRIHAHRHTFIHMYMLHDPPSFGSFRFDFH